MDNIKSIALLNKNEVNEYEFMFKSAYLIEYDNGDKNGIKMANCIVIMICPRLN